MGYSKTQTDGYLATGVVRVKESSLMGPEALNRMIDAKTADDAYGILGEFDYADELLKENDSHNYEVVLQHDFLQTKQFVFEVSEDESIKEWLFIEYDFHNLKSFFKELYFDVDLSAYVSRLSVVDSALLGDAVKDESKPLGHDRLQEIIVDMRSNHDEMGDSFTAEFVDSHLDARYFEYMLELANEIGNSVALDLTQKRIDLANAKLVMRAKRLEKDFAFVRERFIDDGNFEVAFYESRYDSLDEYHVLLQAVSQQFIASKIDAVFSEAESSENLFDLEKAFEMYEVELIRYAKKQPFGLEVLLSYVLSKFVINRNVRRVISGKLNGVEAAEISSRVTELV